MTGCVRAASWSDHDFRKPLDSALGGATRVPVIACAS